MSVTGFTLDVDAEPEVCDRLLKVVWAELHRIEVERQGLYPYLLTRSGPVPVKQRGYRLDGTLTVRNDISTT